MKPSRGQLLALASLLALGGAVTLLPAQQQATPPAKTSEYAPPPAKALDPAKLKAIADKLERLGHAIGVLRAKKAPDALLIEIEVYYKAVAWMLRYNEFYNEADAAATLQVLDDGLLRAGLAAQGDFSWMVNPGFTVARAYRSRIDGSIQPFALTLPADYGKDPKKLWRLDVVLHGRDSTLTEVKFLRRHNGARAPKGGDFVRLDIYGRGNNAYRWAGEVDVFEAMEQVMGPGSLIDPGRLVLRGFSMGGAGTWHIGLQHPDRWCVLGPGAGFTTTHGYIKGLPKLPSYQEKCLSIYDAVDYADNVFDVPVVSYGGALDPQLQSTRNIEAALKQADFPYDLKVLVAPGLAHQFPAEWQKKAEEAYAAFVAKGREEHPRRVRFVTYTLRYPSCDWVEILALNRHYERALVDVEKTENGLTVKTANVRTLHLGLQAGALDAVTVNIDGRAVTGRPWARQDGSLHLYLQRRGKDWAVILPERVATERARQLRKITGLQGPIDDAFMSSFLCVRGTGKPWHGATHKYAEANLERFQNEWGKFWRGDLPVKDDKDVDSNDLARYNLILFGDPASNSLIAQVLDGLPLQWTRQAITLNGKTFAAGEHVPVMIYPSPLNAARYVVLNSGHTFHAAEYLGTNAQLYPRLGDYAVLQLAPTQGDPLAVNVGTAGLFDDSWQFGQE